MLLRKSTQTLHRPYSQLDGQVFRINRGRAVHNARGGTSFVPLESYWREAACLEVNCRHYQEGWWTRLPLGPEQNPEDLALNRARYNYIREQSGRSFVETWEGATAVFHFGAEQKCFRQHKLPVERDPIFVQVNSAGPARRLDYDQFFDSFNETSYWLNRRKQNG